MTLLRAFVTHELRLHSRSLRSRFIVLAWMAATMAVPAWMFVMSRSDGHPAPASFMASAIAAVLPSLTLACSAALTFDAITRERDENSLPVLGLAPISNAGYALRRWAANVAPCLALSALPVVVGFVLALAGGGQPDAGRFGWPWLFEVAPCAILGCALGQAFGTIAGGTILAILEMFLVAGLLLSLGNDLLARFDMAMSAPQFVDSNVVQRVLGLPFESMAIDRELGSDAPLDPLLEAERALGGLTFLVAFAFAALGVSIAYLRRTQPDVKPRPVRPDHPLRGFLGWLNKTRLAVRPDPALGRADRAAIALCFVPAIVVISVYVARFRHYQGIASARYAAEAAGWPEPTAADVATPSWRVSGTLQRDGDWEGRFAIEVVNGSDAAQSRLACALGQGVEVSALHAGARAVTSERRWDRVEVAWAPPLAPGESLTLEGVVAGRPCGLDLQAISWFRGFSQFYEVMSGNGLAGTTFDFSQVATFRRAGPSSVQLRAHDLAPVPRYETWKIQRIGDGYASRTAVVRDDRAPATRVEIDIVSDEGLLLADACGDVSRGDDAPRLSGSCSLPLAIFEVDGGRLVRLPEAPDTVAAVLVLPGHAARAAEHASLISGVGQEAASAWPGLAIARPAFVESPMGWHAWDDEAYSWEPARVSGALVRVNEFSSLGPQVSAEPESLASVTVAGSLLARRPTRREQSLFFRRFLRAVVAARIGGGAETAIVESADGQPLFRFQQSLLEARGWDPLAWGDRLPALVRYLREQVGDEGLRRGIDVFLARPGTGDARELFEAIATESRKDLGPLYEDFVEGEAMPQLTLEGVTFTDGAGGGWRVAGVVRNESDGRVRCPVVVRTAGEPVTVTLDVPSKDAASFETIASDRPRLVLMDPSGVAFRYRPKGGIGIVERVEHGGAK